MDENEIERQQHQTYWEMVWSRLKKHKLGMVSLLVISLFCFVGVYAPFLASSKPIAVYYDGSWYFPLFRYLFYTGFFTKRIDLFFNILMFTLPAFILSFYLFKKAPRLRKLSLVALFCIQIGLFIYFSTGSIRDPAADPTMNAERQKVVQQVIKETGNAPLPSWDFDLKYMNDYAKLNMILRYNQRKNQHEKLMTYHKDYQDAALSRWADKKAKKKQIEMLRKMGDSEQIPSQSQLKQNIFENASKEDLGKIGVMPSLYQMNKDHRDKRLKLLNDTIQRYRNEGDTDSESYRYAVSQKRYIIDRYRWVTDQSQSIQFNIMPLIRPFHWEDDAGGEQSLNQFIGWTELTRINRKDLFAALIFGVRISLVVGVTAVALALAIGVPIGAFAGYYGGNFDIFVSRLLEIWESMPTFFMLLLVVAITQSKSIFLIVTVIGIFGWTSFSRYIRGEFFKQRNLSYVEACRASGFNDRYIIFSHILPNAFPPLLTLLPFAIMGAITSEAGLSFLGLGEEGSSSWGVLMDEGRMAFPGESYLLWPPAILLTILLIAIALLGDALRDALDPKVLK
ncbi:MAG: ABC transporter permease [Chlamydiota bacterium]